MRGTFCSYICHGSNLLRSILPRAAFREWWVKQMTPATHPALGALIHSQDLAITPALIWQKMEQQAVWCSRLWQQPFPWPPSPCQQVCCSLLVPHCNPSGLQREMETKATWLAGDFILVQQGHTFLSRDCTMGTPAAPMAVHDSCTCVDSLIVQACGCLLVPCITLLITRRWVLALELCSEYEMLEQDLVAKGFFLLLFS